VGNVSNLIEAPKKTLAPATTEMDLTSGFGKGPGVSPSLWSLTLLLG